MRQLTEDNLTDAVLARLKDVKDPRFKQVMTSLIKHLHAFAREVRLTGAEWQRGNRVPDPDRAYDRRPEAGVHPAVRRARAVHADRGHQRAAVRGRDRVHRARAVLVGPGSPGIPLGRRPRARGERRSLLGRGPGGGHRGRPVAGARIEVWQADADGFYDVQYEGARTAGRGWLRSGPDGEYRFWSVHPAPYPIPADGPVGDLLAAAGRGPMRPAHLHSQGRRARLPDADHAFLRGRGPVPGPGCGVRGKGRT